MAAWQMAQLPLWGYWPLLLVGSFWLGLILLLGGSFSRSSLNWRWLAISHLTPLFLTLGFVPLPAFPLLFVGFVPLLWVEHEISASEVKRKHWTLFKYVFSSFLTWNLLTTFWVLNSTFAAGLLAFLLNALFMSIPFMLYHVTRRLHNEVVGRGAFVVYWLSFEWAHLNWDLSWPWLTLGNSFAHLPYLVQWYEWTGVFGGSLWILVANVWLFKWFWAARGQWKSLPRSFGIQWALWLLLPIVVSLIRYSSYQAEAVKKANIVAVQPNFEPHYQKFEVSDAEQMQRFVQLSQSALDSTTDYLIYPETSFSGLIKNRLAGESEMQALYRLIEPYPKVKLVAGISSFELFDSDAILPDNVRRSPSGQYYVPHNAAIQLSSETDSILYYKKSKLVPGAESMPFIGDIPFFQDLVLDLGGAQGLSLGTQPERSVFGSETGLIAPVICYESVYGEYMSEYVQKGAQAIFVVTNDGWWDNTPGHIQHLHFSRLRAIEARRVVVRSANSGVSAVINSRGDIVQRSQYDEAATLKAEIPLLETQTLYSQNGDMIARIASLLAMLGLLATLARTIRGRRD